jgi:hypothetical protein
MLLVAHFVGHYIPIRKNLPNGEVFLHIQLTPSGKTVAGSLRPSMINRKAL